MLWRVDRGRHAGGGAQFGEIAGEPVGNVHRRTGMVAHRLRQRVARLRHAIAADQHLALPRHRSASAAATAPPFRISRPSAASPIVPVTTMRSPGFAPLRWTILPRGTRPNAVIEIISGPGVETVSPPSSGQPNGAASSPSARANGASQPSSTRPQRQRQHEARRRRALGGEIGQVHPQRLARDGVGRIVGQKMHAFDDGVRRHHDLVAVACRTAASSTRPNAPGSVAIG